MTVLAFCFISNSYASTDKPAFLYLLVVFLMQMTQHNVGALVVVKPGQDKEIAGIVTERGNEQLSVITGIKPLGMIRKGINHVPLPALDTLDQKFCSQIFGLPLLFVVDRGSCTFTLGFLLKLCSCNSPSLNEKHSMHVLKNKYLIYYSKSVSSYSVPLT
jgi:hypothetical protein